MPLLFSYGTLQQANVQLATFGRLLAGSRDALVGYEQSLVAIDDAEVVRTSGKAHHPIVKYTGEADARVPGTVFEITAHQLEQADRYEVSAYKRVAAPLSSGGTAWVYVDARYAPPVSMNAESRKPIFLGPGQGRSYPMGRISAVFKADEAETQSRYSVSEWWLEPKTRGPGAHAHAEDDLFYVIEGVMSIRVGEEWHEASTGSFVLVPGGVTHDFENRGAVRAGVLNFSAPGPFEPDMPGIVEWFAKNPPQDTGP
jgi:mannose-6-phosphate isomerase-like protein (cupin superfamily)